MIKVRTQILKLLTNTTQAKMIRQYLKEAVHHQITLRMLLTYTSRNLISDQIQKTTCTGTIN